MGCSDYMAWPSEVGRVLPVLVPNGEPTTKHSVPSAGGRDIPSHAG